MGHVEDTKVKEDPKKLAEIDKQNAEVKARFEKDRKAAHEKDPNVRVDTTPGISEVAQHVAKEPEEKHQEGGDEHDSV